MMKKSKGCMKHCQTAERKDEEKEKRVYGASVTGSVSLLKQLMAKDPRTSCGHVL